MLRATRLPSADYANRVGQRQCRPDFPTRQSYRIAPSAKNVRNVFCMKDDPGLQLRRLRAFVVRARRIREHSLAKDIDELKQLRNAAFKFRFSTKSDKIELINNLPPEEQVESAAARVRPLILNEELTYHAKAMGAVLYFARAGGISDAGIGSLRELKKSWASIAPHRKSLTSYEVRTVTTDGDEVAASDNALGFAWIYGDVVHAAEERRSEGEAFGIDERFRAAVPIVAKLMYLAITTLSVVEQLASDGIIPDLGDALTEQVVVPETMLGYTVSAIVSKEYPLDEAPPTPPPMNERIPPDWEPVNLRLKQAYKGLVVRDEPAQQFEEAQTENPESTPSD